MAALPELGLGLLQREAVPSAKPDFAALVGAAGWLRLAPDIRRRFAAVPAETQPIRYDGIMSRVECSPAGWLLAQLCRIVGTPFAPHRGSDVPVTITLHQASRDGAVLWERDYRYFGRPPVLVRSIKRSAPEGGLLECVGAGFAMRLAVTEEHSALHFRCSRYVWRLGRWQIPLPALLSPGAAHVVHEDLGDGSFRFAMTIRHRVFGLLFEQEGVFQDGEAAQCACPGL